MGVLNIACKNFFTVLEMAWCRHSQNLKFLQNRFIQRALYMINIKFVEDKTVLELLKEYISSKMKDN